MKSCKRISSLQHISLVFWAACYFCLNVSLCDTHPQYRSEEEIDEASPPILFPTNKSVLGGALEAADMLNTTKIQPGENNATELVDNPHVVDLGGKTHEESGNTTTSYITMSHELTEDLCKVPMDWLKDFQETTHNYTFPSDWLRDSRGVPLIDCVIITINNSKKFQCPIPPSNTTDEGNSSSFITDIPEEKLNFSDNVSFSACPQLQELFTTATTNPTFNCSDKIDGNIRTTICHISKQWLRNQTIITKLNCTNSGNTTTGTETCVISKEIVQKNIANVLNCVSLNNDGVACLVPQEWVKYNVFSALNCAEQQNSTLKNCSFPSDLLTTNAKAEYVCSSGNTTNNCSIYESINCTKNANSTNMQCHIPESWLKEGNEAPKVNCTNGDSNSTQKLCSIPKEWLRGRASNVWETTKKNESLCYLPQRLLDETAENSQLNCTSNNVTTVCRVPNDGANITEMCPLLNELKDEEKALRCVVEYEGNFTIFVCPESGYSAFESVTESCNTTLTDVEKTENVTAVSQQDIINATSSEMNKADSSANDTKSQINTTFTETIDENKANTSETSTVLAPQLSATVPESQSSQASNSSIKPNIEKSNDATDEGVSYEATENVSDVKVSQSSNETNGKVLAVTQLDHGINHDNSAAPPAFSQLHSEHSHAPLNEQQISFLRPTESAAILVGVFIAFAVLGYAGLLVWRRMLEKRYGNRQLLINEDDDFSNANNFEMPMYELQERFWPRGGDRGISSCDNAQKSLSKKVAC